MLWRFARTRAAVAQFRNQRQLTEDKRQREIDYEALFNRSDRPDGREVVQQGLARGHHVTAFVRSPEGITLRNERLTIVTGSVADEKQLFNAMQNHDAVLSTLRPREAFRPSHFSTTVRLRLLGR